MSMKEHILAALREELAAWDALLGALGERLREAPLPPDGWSPKDELAHLHGWQQRTLARIEAALSGAEPELPAWPIALSPEQPDAVPAINEWLYAQARELPWDAVHGAWRACFARVIERAALVSERDMLDSSRYAWLDQRPLALVLISTYDHHHEHLESLQQRLGRR